MSETYSIVFQNATDQVWHFAVYQKYPSSPGLTSIAWQVLPLGPQEQGNPPPQATVSWTLQYGLCIANFDEANQQFTGQQFASAFLGNIYEVDTIDEAPNIKSSPIGTTNPDQIILANKTSQPVKSLTMGFTLGADHHIVKAEKNVGGGENTLFRVHPDYWVACYRNIELGQMVDADVVIGDPVNVEFKGGVNTHTIKAYKDASGDYHLAMTK